MNVCENGCEGGSRRLMEMEGGWKWKVDGSGSMEVAVDGPNRPQGRRQDFGGGFPQARVRSHAYRVGGVAVIAHAQTFASS